MSMRGISWTGIGSLALSDQGGPIVKQCMPEYSELDVKMLTRLSSVYSALQHGASLPESCSNYVSILREHDFPVQAAVLELFHTIHVDSHNVGLGFANWHAALFAGDFNTSSFTGWPEIKRLVLVGKVNEAVLILKSAQCIWESDMEVTGLVEVLPKVPAFELRWKQQNVFDANIAEWKTLMLSYRQVCKTKDVIDVLSILAGDISVMKSVAKNWMELLAGRLLYDVPALNRSELPANLLKDLSADDLDEGYFKVLIAGKIEETLFTYDAGMRLPWFTALFVDLVWHAGLIPKTITLSSGCTIREHYTLEYCYSLYELPNLWTVSEIYLQQCPVKGKHALKQMAQNFRIPKNEAELHSMLDLCRLNNLQAEKLAIYISLAAYYSSIGDYSSSVLYLLRADERVKVSHTIDRIFNDAVGLFLESHMELFDNLSSTIAQFSTGSCGDDYEFLTRLGKYCKTRSLEVLGDLLGSRCCPRSAFGTLLNHFIERCVATEGFEVSAMNALKIIPKLEDYVLHYDQNFESLKCRQFLASASLNR